MCFSGPDGRPIDLHGSGLYVTILAESLGILDYDRSGWRGYLEARSAVRLIDYNVVKTIGGSLTFLVDKTFVDTFGRRIQVFGVSPDSKTDNITIGCIIPTIFPIVDDTGWLVDSPEVALVADRL
jgi:hypothetical protein